MVINDGRIQARLEQLNQFTKEAENLQKECAGEGQEKNLFHLNKLLGDFTKEIRQTLVERKIESKTGEQSLDKVVKEVQIFQQKLPVQTDAKTILELFKHLFAVISVEMRKVKTVDKKKLESQKKKIVRYKKKGSPIENTHPGKHS